MSTVALILLITFNSLLQIVCCETICCPAQTSSKYPEVIWPKVCPDSSTATLVTSYPYRCLDKYKHFVKRTCLPRVSYAEWSNTIDEVECPYTIHERELVENNCPLNYEASEITPPLMSYCVRVIPDLEWQINSCLPAGSSLTLIYLPINWKTFLDFIIAEMGYQEGPLFWLPAKNLWYDKVVEMENLIGKIDSGYQWTEAGLFGVTVPDYALDATSDDADLCLYVDLALPGGKLLRKECKSRLPMICLHHRSAFNTEQLFCPDGYKTTVFSRLQSLCVKIDRFPVPLPRDKLTDVYVMENVCPYVFPITSRDHLTVFRELASAEGLTEDDRCLFRFNEFINKVVITEKEWIETDMDDVEFVNWSPYGDMSEIGSPRAEQNILVTQSNGEWSWSDSSVTCAICYKTGITLEMPKLELAMDTEMNLFLYVKNNNFLWRSRLGREMPSCYSVTLQSKSIENISLRTVSEVPTTTSSTTESDRFILETNGPGKYWCVGLQVQTFKVIEAEFKWSIPMKFALFARPRYALSGPTSNVFDLFLKDFIDLKRVRVVETSLQNFSDLYQLFHVTMIAIDDDYLTFEKNEIGLNERLLLAYYLHHHLDQVRQITETDPHMQFHILSLNSTEFCLPSTISELAEFNWHGARIGQHVSSNEYCLLKANGLPATKRCIGDGLYGGVWMETVDKIECENSVESPVSKHLHNFTLLPMSNGDIYRLSRLIFTTNYSSLIAADIVFFGQIIEDIQYSVIIHLSRPVTRLILNIYNRLLMIRDEVMYVTSSLNTTNVLLAAIDGIVANYVTSGSAMLPCDKGIISFQFDEPMLSTFIFDPVVTNFTGIVATQTESSNLTIAFLDKFADTQDLLGTPNLIVASYLPAKLLNHLSNPFIIVSLFVNDILFRPYNQFNMSYSSFQMTAYPKSGGSILSVVITEALGDLPESLPIFVRPNRPGDELTEENACGFWSFPPDIDGWDTDGCSLTGRMVSTDVVLCECYHFTHYAYLLYGNATPIDPKHFDKLQLITFIACSISLIGLCGIFLSAMLFGSWRRTLSTKYLLQLCTALAFELIMILFVSTEKHTRIWIETKKSSTTCIVLGALLHYTVLVTWMWMFVIGYMQYRRYVVVFQKFDSSKIFLISSVLGWMVPMIPVATVLSIDRQSYIPSTNVNFSICYPSGSALYLALMAPIILITMANLMIFMLVIKSLSVDAGGRNETRAIILSKLRLAIFLFFLLGLTWIFSFLSATNVGVVFTYLFCVTATLQGFVLFFYFVILDPIVRGLWLTLCCKWN